MEKLLQMSQKNPNNRLFIEYLINIKDDKDTLYNYYTNPVSLKNSLDSFPGVKYSDAFEILHIFIFGQVITPEQETLFDNLFLSPQQKLEQYFNDIGQIRKDFSVNISDEEILKIFYLVNVINDKIRKLSGHLILNINELQNYSSNLNKLDELVEQFSLPKEMITDVINMILEKSNSYPNFNPFMNQPRQLQNQNLYYPQYQNSNPYISQPPYLHFPMNQPPFLNPNELNNPNLNPPFIHQTITQYPASQNSYFPQNQNFNSYMNQPQPQFINNPNNPNQYTYYPPSQNNWENQNYYQNQNLSYMSQPQVPNNFYNQNLNSNFSMNQPSPHFQNNFYNPNQYSHQIQNNLQNFPPSQHSTFQPPFSAPNIFHSQNPTYPKNDSNPFINRISLAMLVAKRKFENDIKSLKSNMEAIKNSNELSKIADALNSFEQQLRSYIDSILDILNKNEHDDNAQTKLKVIMEIYKKSNLNVKDINSIVTFLINLSEIYPIKNESEKQTNDNDVKLLKKALEAIKNSKLLPTVAETLDLPIETLISYIDYIINIIAQENINENIQNLNEAVKNLDIEDFDSIILFIITLLEKHPLNEMPKEVNNNSKQQNNEDKTINPPFIFLPNDLKEENNNANINDNEEKIKSIPNPQPIFLIPNPNDSKKDNSDEDEIEFQVINMPTNSNQFSALDFEELLNSNNAKAQNSENQQIHQTETLEKPQEKLSIFNKINDKLKNEDVPKLEPDEKSQEKK